jgi:hypothetical protein
LPLEHIWATFRGGRCWRSSLWQRRKNKHKIWLLKNAEAGRIAAQVMSGARSKILGSKVQIGGRAKNDDRVRIGVMPNDNRI